MTFRRFSRELVRTPNARVETGRNIPSATERFISKSHDRWGFILHEFAISLSVSVSKRPSALTLDKAMPGNKLWPLCRLNTVASGASCGKKQLALNISISHEVLGAFVTELGKSDGQAGSQAVNDIEIKRAISREARNQTVSWRLAITLLNFAASTGILKKIVENSRFEASPFLKNGIPAT